MSGSPLRTRLARYFRADVYRRFLPYAWRFRRLMVGAVLLEVAVTALGLLEPWPMKFLIDSGIGRLPLPGWLARLAPGLVTAGGTTVIVVAVAAILALRLVGNAGSLLGGYLKTRANEGMRVDLRSDLFHHLQRLSFAYHDRTTVSDSLYRLNNDAPQMSVLIWSNFRHLITSLVALAGILVVVVHLDWQMAALAVAAAPIQYVAIGFWTKLFREKSRRVRGMETDAQTVLHETLSALRTVKAFGQEERERRRFQDVSREAVRAGLRLGFEQDLFDYGVAFLSKIDRALILLVGGLHAVDGRISVGELLVILAYVNQIHEPIEGIGHAFTDMQQSLVSAERVLEVLDVQPEVVERPGAVDLPQASGAVAFEDVSFAYGDDRPAVEHVSFAARPGEVVALVGPTGAGKTTLASLIVRFYDPGSGSVKLDGHHLRDLTLRSLRNAVTLVLQEPTLLLGTVRENVAYGRPEASLPEVIAAARAANAHDFIAALPQGYDTEVGERGVRLSGGERQRIAIARAFLKDARVIVLDEPTASVDSRTERTILEALERLMIGRTTFIIAHRLSTVRHADQILVLDHGRVVEHGTHAELVARTGLYAELHAIQAGSFARETAPGVSR